MLAQRDRYIRRDDSQKPKWKQTFSPE